MNACAKAGELDGAEGWLAAMGKNGVKPDGVSYSTLVHACITARDAARAQKWLEKMIVEGSADGEPNAFCYNAVVQAWAKQGDAERASHWLSKAIADKADPTNTSFTSVISAWKKVGDANEVEKWTRRMNAALRPSRADASFPETFGMANSRGTAGPSQTRGRSRPALHSQ